MTPEYQSRFMIQNEAELIQERLQSLYQEPKPRTKTIETNQTDHHMRHLSEAMAPANKRVLSESHERPQEGTTELDSRWTISGQTQRVKPNYDALESQQYSCLQKLMESGRDAGGYDISSNTQNDSNQPSRSRIESKNSVNRQAKASRQNSSAARHIPKHLFTAEKTSKTKFVQLDKTRQPPSNQSQGNQQHQQFNELSTDEAKYINLQKLLRNALLKSSQNKSSSASKTTRHRRIPSDGRQIPNRKGQRMLKDITDFNLLERNVRERAGSGGYDQDPSL